MHRLLTRRLIVLGLLMAPLPMIGLDSRAAAQSEEVATAGAESRCGAADHHRAHEGAPQEAVHCAGACMALPSTAMRIETLPAPSRLYPALPRPRLRPGLSPEGETPPPRIASEQ